MAKDNKYKSTQSYLQISEIKMDTIIMQDGNHLAVVGVSSTNFALKSQEEQNALIYAYQSFLNTLDFDIQILVQSRKMDIHTYLNNLKQVMERQTNELLRVQTAEYIEFIEKLIENSSIMNKNFYIIVPYRPSIVGKQEKKGFFSSLFRKKTSAEELASVVKQFQDNKTKLDQRVATILSGLSSMGLKAMQLSTPELIELVYNSYNFSNGPAIDVNRLGDIDLKNDIDLNKEQEKEQ